MAKLLNVTVLGKKYLADSMQELRELLQADIDKIGEDIKKIGGAGDDIIKKLLEEKKKAMKEWDAKILLAKNTGKTLKQKAELQKALEQLK